LYTNGLQALRFRRTRRLTMLFLIGLNLQIKWLSRTLRR
jgi:hypothetical protein